MIPLFSPGGIGLGVRIVAALALLAGCADTLARRQARLIPLIGRPVGDLIQQLGVPNRTYETGGVKYLAYEETQVQVLPGVPGAGFWSGGWGSGIPPEVIQWQCQTTFAVAGGLVRSYALHGNGCG